MEKDHYKNIRAYLKGELTAEENRSFEEQLSADPGLEKEVDIQRVEMEAIEFMMKEDLMSKMEQWGKDYHDRSSSLPLKVKYLRYAAIAVAASLLIVFGFLSLFWVPGYYSNESIALDHVNKELLLSGARSGTGNYSSAKTLFREGKYSEVIEIFRNIKPGDENYFKAMNLMGYSYFYMKEYEQAAEVFKSLVNNSSGRTIYKENAEWGLLLSYLSNDQLNQEFYDLLNDIISEPNHSSYDDAIEVKTKLESRWRKLLF